MGANLIPVNPTDGQQYSAVGLLGLPLVLEYDASTGGYKLVVATEVGTVINVSGTVQIEAGDLLTLDDAMPNPDALPVASFGAVYNPELNTWQRVYGWYMGGNNPISDLGVAAPLSNALLRGYHSENVDWESIRVDASGSVAAYLPDGTAIVSGKTIQHTVVNISGSGGEHSLVDLVADQTINVLEMMLLSQADVDIFFQSGFSGTPLSGPLPLPARGDGFFLNSPANRDVPHFKTAVGEPFVVDLSAAAPMGGWIKYYLES